MKKFSWKVMQHLVVWTLFDLVWLACSDLMSFLMSHISRLDISTQLVS